MANQQMVMKRRRQSLWQRVVDAIEFFLVKWGWLIFAIGLGTIWLPLSVPWREGVAIAFAVPADFLGFYWCVRFLGHASYSSAKKDYGKAAMFLVLSLPFFAFLCLSSLYGDPTTHLRLSDSARQWFVTGFLGVVWLFCIGMRWWYVSGQALALYQSSEGSE